MSHTYEHKRKTDTLTRYIMRPYSGERVAPDDQLGALGVCVRACVCVCVFNEKCNPYCFQMLHYCYTLSRSIFSSAFNLRTIETQVSLNEIRRNQTETHSNTKTHNLHIHTTPTTIAAAT